MKANLQIFRSYPCNCKASAQTFLFAAIVFFCITIAHAQLPSFTLSVAATNETCPGNGTLNSFISGTDPAAIISFQVFLLPNTTATISTSSFVDGLTSGTYQIVATQTLGSDSNTQTQQVSISDETIPLLYTNVGTPVNCGSNGTITVNVYSGTAVSYEIISGPVIRQLQTSNVFGGLPAGVFEIRVFDNCGEGWVTTHTLIASTGNFLQWTESVETESFDCSGMTITNTLSSDLNASLVFPATITYTVNPPNGGAPIVTTQTVTSDVSLAQFITVIPYASPEVYEYNVTVTDACGNGYYFDKVLISKQYLVEFRSPPAQCGEYYITFAQSNFVAPVTVNFVNHPAGFDPTTFNPNHPGPFASNLISYGGDTDGVPFGFYKATLTDACGHSVTVEADLQYIDPEPTVTFEQNPGCDSDRSTTMIQLTGYTFVTAVLEFGPPTFAASYPVDVTSFISNGALEVANMNTGNYSVTLTDDCGNTHIFPFFVPAGQTNFEIFPRTACELGHGAIRIKALEGVLVQSVIMTAAPANYPQALPYDVSFNINTSFPEVFSMTSLPEGDYTFDIIDSCGHATTITRFIPGYVVTQNTYTIIPHCGSFDLDFNWMSTGTNALFWLQKLDPVTGNWVHPQTGVVYVPGQTPSNATGYLILNHIMNYNISFLGDFRIIHRYETWGNGNENLNKACIEVVQQFTFFNEIEIVDIQKTTCNGLRSNVSITAIGVPPLTYQITTKNGLPFFADNGTNNVFADLEPAVYNFLIFDSCGNISNQLTDVALLPSLVQINSAQDLLECDGDDNDNQAKFDLTLQTPIVLGSALPTNYTLTYHRSQSEAAIKSNPIANPQNYTSVSDTIFCRVEYMGNSGCFDITSFEIIVNAFPELQMQLSYAICSGENVTIAADSGFDSYLWSTGETTPTIVVDTPGTYTLEVTQTTNGVTCTATYTITVIASQPAVIRQIETSDWTNDQNTITVILADTVNGNYLYSLDNVNFQQGNVFYGLVPGAYTVYVKDVNGCDPVSQEVFLLSYPKFFTPNDDGYNDYWQIINAAAEPNLKVYVFDRYGKLLKNFGSSSPGWDGYYNKRQMPSTDYWFLVIRENGKEHRGHFAMKR